MTGGRGNVTLASRKSKKGELGNYRAVEPHSVWGQTLLEATSWHRKDKRVLGNVWHRITNSKPCDGPE